jgi:hypothetical protein
MVDDVNPGASQARAGRVGLAVDARQTHVLTEDGA